MLLSVFFLLCTLRPDAKECSFSFWEGPLSWPLSPITITFLNSLFYELIVDVFMSVDDIYLPNGNLSCVIVEEGVLTSVLISLKGIWWSTKDCWCFNGKSCKSSASIAFDGAIFTFFTSVQSVYGSAMSLVRMKVSKILYDCTVSLDRGTKFHLCCYHIFPYFPNFFRLLRYIARGPSRKLFMANLIS